jgi:hypothetical protein
MAPATYSVSEAAEQLQLAERRLSYFIKLGAVVPAQPATGRGTPVRLSVANLYELLLAEYYWDAGLNAPQVVQVLTTLRATLARTPPEQREAVLFGCYVGAIDSLAQVFGKGEGYAAWKKAATATLRRLETEAKQRTAAKKHSRVMADDPAIGPSLGLLAVLKELPPNALRTRHASD